MKQFPYVYLLIVFFFSISHLEASPQTDEFNQLAKKAHENGTVRVLVELKDSLDAKDFEVIKKNPGKQTSAIEYQQKALMKDIPIRNTKAIKHYEHFAFVAMSVTEDELKKLHKSARVSTIYKDRMYFPTANMMAVTQYLGADVGWSSGSTGKGQTIVVIDTGVDRFHPFLRNKVVREACISSRIEDKWTGIQTVTPLCRKGHTNITGKGAANVDCHVGDVECAHGTYAALLAAGNSGAPDFRGSGIAPEAKVIAIKAISSFNETAACAPNTAPCIAFQNSDLLKALDYVLKINRRNPRLHIAAVNMSLGGPGECSRDPLRRAIKALRKAKIATIVASGNDGTPYTISTPACIPEAISVGATNSDTHEISDFSNGARSLDLLAPGEGIAVPYFNVDPKQELALDGTSFSAPLVTGAWAALKSHKPNAKVEEILHALQSTGVSIVDFRNATIKPEIRVNAAQNALAP